MRRGGTFYERVESQIRYGAGFHRPLRQILVEGALIISSIFLLAYLLYAAQFSGRVRWALGFAMIAIIAGYAWWTVARRTSEPVSLAPPSRRGLLRTGELSAFSAVVRRANQGLAYSQVAVSSRAREAFANRTRLAHGLSPEGMRRLGQDPAGLQSALHDVVLEDFLYLRTTDPDERQRWVYESKYRGGFESALREVLRRMEEWR